MNESLELDIDLSRCFRASFSRLKARVELACSGEDQWIDGAASALVSVLEFAVEDPRAVLALTSQALSRDAEGFAQQEMLVNWGAKRLTRSWCATESIPVSAPRLSDRALIAGFVMLIGQRLSQHREPELLEGAGDIVQAILLPYVGIDAAKQAATRQAC